MPNHEGFIPPSDTSLPIAYTPPDDGEITHRYVLGDNAVELDLMTLQAGRLHIFSVETADVARKDYRPRGLGTYALAFACNVAERTSRPYITADMLSPFSLRIVRRLVGDGPIDYFRIERDENDRTRQRPLFVTSDIAEKRLRDTYNPKTRMSSEILHVDIDLTKVPDERRAAINDLVRKGLPWWEKDDDGNVIPTVRDATTDSGSQKSSRLPREETRDMLGEAFGLTSIPEGLGAKDYLNIAIELTRRAEQAAREWGK